MSKILSGVLVIVLTIAITAVGCTSDTTQNLSPSSTADAALQQAQSQLLQTQTELTALQTSYDAAAKKISELEGKPAARYFESTVELANWLNKNTVSEEPQANTYVSWYNKALKVQEQAALDGFLISVQYHFCDERQVIEYIACLALIKGYLFMWDPETDDVVEDPYWDRIR